MRRLLVVLLVFIPLCSLALEYPPASSYRVNDYAKILTDQERTELEAMLAQQERDSTNQIVVAIFPTLEQESLEDYVNRLFERWRIGQKTNNNGVLLAIFLKERKVRIEVGYGLEGRLTDALTSRIIRNELAPHFRTGAYAPGIRGALVAIQKAIAGEYKPAVPPQQKPEGLPFSPGTLIFLGFIVLYFLYHARNSGTYIDRRGRRRRRGGWFIYPGGGWGSGGSGWGSGGGWGGGGGFSGGGGLSGGGGASGSW